ncbi:MAG: hypothetical protein M1826_000517 [Phylliscum demangeonii]|nr:MAG: hypothetical protein M1826_000517 [Phylliscum demangeonii]
MNALPADEYALLQARSDAYQPEGTGPLVGERQSTQAIAAEYAQADDVLVHKTTALPRRYPSYRTIQGDGNCGWRALGFGYIETLVGLADRNRLLEEQTRLRSLNNLLNRVGYQSHLYEDFADATFDLLNELAALVPSPEAQTTLLRRFNDSSISSAIIMHLRLLTAAWMKTHASAYQPWITDGRDVLQYCSAHIEPYQVEIEHLGMNALIDVLIKPARMAVEVLYLDRSPGEEVNTHRFEAAHPDPTALYPDPPTLHLLYRPGHYDLLYRHVVDRSATAATDRQMDALSHQVATQVHLVPVLSHGHFQPVPIAASIDMSLASIIPGLSTVVPGPGPGPGSTAAEAASILPYEMASSAHAALAMEYPPTSPLSPVTPTALFPSPTSLRFSLSLAGGGGGGGPGGGADSFRPSRYELEPDVHASTAQSRHYQTPSFRNSHFNPAHFRSSEFQPEQWRPEIDATTTRRSRD